MNKKRNYQIVKEGHWIEITEGPFKGTIYKYGEVKFVEDGDEAKLSFVYTVLEGGDESEEFKTEIGDILVDLIKLGLASNNIVYKGGIDED